MALSLSEISGKANRTVCSPKKDHALTRKQRENRGEDKSILLLEMRHPTFLVNFLTGKLGLYSFRARLASRVLERQARKCRNIAEYIALTNEVFCGFPLRFIGWPIKPAQVPQELGTLLSKVSNLNVERMLEIGTFKGGTLFLFTRMANSNAEIISLDMPGGEFGGGYERFKIPFFTGFAQEQQKIYLIREDSHLPRSLQKVKSTLKGKSLDFLFIDGDHSYRGVKQDFEMYSPLVRKGGLVAFHDICKHPPELRCDVSSYWNEIKRSHKYEEIIADPNQGWAGIGLIYM